MTKATTYPMADKRHWAWPLLIVALLILFSLFSQTSLTIALLFLFTAQAGILFTLRYSSLRDIFSEAGFSKGKFTLPRATWPVLTGLAFALLYRYILRQPLWITGLTPFVAIAVLIGITEELVYRGYLLGKLRQYNPAVVVIATALAHALYKACLFASFPGINLVIIFSFTFGVGLLLGAFRLAFKSIYPCLLFHGLFDLLVYGDRFTAPWWVW